MGKRRDVKSKARDRNMLQAVALGLVTLPPLNFDDPEGGDPHPERNVICDACVRAARELGWALRRSPTGEHYSWQVWRPGMGLPWYEYKPYMWNNEALRLQSCCRMIMKKSILNEEGT
jgi:hypothetical protein